MCSQRTLLNSVSCGKESTFVLLRTSREIKLILIQKKKKWSGRGQWRVYSSLPLWPIDSNAIIFIFGSPGDNKFTTWTEEVWGKLPVTSKWLVSFCKNEVLLSDLSPFLSIPQRAAASPTGLGRELCGGRRVAWLSRALPSHAVTSGRPRAPGPGPRVQSLHLWDRQLYVAVSLLL